MRNHNTEAAQPENQSAGQDMLSSSRNAEVRTAQSTWKPSPASACQGDETLLARPKNIKSSIEHPKFSVWGKG